MADVDVARIYKKLDEIREDISGVKQQLALMSGHCDGCTESIDSLKTTVFGNGSKGVKMQCEMNKRRIEEHVTTSMSDKIWRRTAFFMGAIAICGWMVTLAIAFFESHSK